MILHLFSMRYLLLTYFTLFSLCAFAHQSALDSAALQKVEIKLNVILKDSLIRGKSYVKFIRLSDEEKSDDNYLDSTIRAVLMKHEILKGGYNVHVYWDHYSDRVYSSLNTQKLVEDGSFPNYSNYEASPRGGYKKFKDSLRIDLLELLADEDWYAKHAFSSTVEVMIDKDGNAQYLLNDHIHQFNRISEIKWFNALYYAKPRNHFLRIRILKKYQDGKVSDIVIDDNFSTGIVYLEGRFEENIVRLEQYTSNTPIPSGNVVVSLVYNASTKFFENPIIHQGDNREAEDFISWLEAYSFSDYVFHWEGWPESNRYYFYYN